MKMNKYKVAGILSLVLLVLTPIFNKLVNVLFRSESGYGFGSECLIWLFPFMIIALVDAFGSEFDESL